jgi:SRSO17 transposase
MDGDQIRAIEPLLREYVNRFSECFARRDTAAHFPRYVEGQLSDLQRKSVEPMALAMNVPVRTLQEFLSQHKWDHEAMRDRLQQIVRDEHGGGASGDGSAGETIGIIDETSAVKKGDKTPGVQRQHCGAIGKQENCIVLVNLALARGDFHCLLDGELFLPKSWSDDRPRCQAAGIPGEMVYRPKSEIALEQYRQATSNGLVFDWLTFDEWYGAKPEFLRALDQETQKFVAEVPKNFRAWIDPPRVTNRPFHKGKRGRGRKTPRIVAGEPKLQTVEQLAARHPALSDQDWQRWRVKDTQKGPVVWEVKHTLVVVKDERGLPGATYHLVVARNAAHPEEVKYFISNAPPQTQLETLLRVAFSRWRIERCYEDQKGEIGLTHFEGRRYVGLKRHLMLSCVSYLFLAKVRHSLRGKKSGADSMPSSHGGQCGRPLVVA